MFFIFIKIILRNNIENKIKVSIINMYYICVLRRKKEMKKLFLIILVLVMWSQPVKAEQLGDIAAEIIFNSIDDDKSEPEKKPQATVKVKKTGSGARVVEFKISDRDTVSGGQNVNEVIDAPVTVAKIREYFKEKLEKDGKDEDLKVGKVRSSGKVYIVEIRDRDSDDVDDDNGFLRERITIDSKTGEITNEEEFQKYKLRD